MYFSEFHHIKPASLCHPLLFSISAAPPCEKHFLIRATIFQVLVFSAWFFTAIVVTSLLSMANGSKKFGEYFVLVAAKGRARSFVVKKIKSAESVKSVDHNSFIYISLYLFWYFCFGGFCSN
jgi:hypothetical protein